MILPLQARPLRFVALAMTLGLLLSPAARGQSSDPVVFEDASGERWVLEPSAEPVLPKPEPVRWIRDGRATKVLIEDQVVFSFKEDDGRMAKRVAQRLSAFRAQGSLRGDRVSPGRRGKRYTVNVGGAALLEIDDAFARTQGVRPGGLVLSYVNALRKALGGVPIQVQASRGLLPGARSGIGMASWYGGIFHGRRAASGERFDMHAYTAAHKTLPFGTLLLVTNLRNGKTALVRVTDRGPYAHGRTLDLSRAAANALGMLGSGVARVRYTVLK